ncbi:hypothetical protein PCL_07268 [Purpureocillium lilacinum]|uniref:HPt domain-containing protein n=1 Tax=Purpureocillium lilacinum TaxID=33203 RepID=A0A2U3DSJ1_PURLI|nr:hypothetical protein PCL_07268 [Purpureocillium lilacinum]
MWMIDVFSATCVVPEDGLDPGAVPLSCQDDHRTHPLIIALYEELKGRTLSRVSGPALNCGPIREIANTHGPIHIRSRPLAVRPSVMAPPSPSGAGCGSENLPGIGIPVRSSTGTDLFIRHGQRDWRVPLVNVSYMPRACNTFPIAGEGHVELGLGDGVDMSTFKGILELDDPGDCEFSSSIISIFLAQARDTFESMNVALEAKELENLSQLAHFLRGSSATLGLVKIYDGCERIQLCVRAEKERSAELHSKICLNNIIQAVEMVKEQYQMVETVLRTYYESRSERR